MELEAIDFALRENLGETLKTLGFRAQQKGLELAWRVGPEVPEHLMGDLGRMRQMVTNLVGNAIKFTEKGEVVLEVEKENESDGMVELHFRVRDTGVGISKEKQDYIFGAFTQADSSTTRKYGGTGLGLAITRRLVEIMGGKIWVESELGHGSTFHFTVRFGVSNLLEAALPTIDPSALRDSPVLVVDDNKTNRVILTEMLKGWGMRPTAVEGANLALADLSRASAQGLPFKILITDMHMPDIDGFTLAGEIRKNPAFRAIPILMLSSGPHEGERARSVATGISAYLLKPVKPSELLDAMLNAVAKSQEIPQKLPQTEDSFVAEGQRMKILLAEDNDVNRTLATRLLEKHGNTVVTAGNGREALEALERENIDLVLMDLQMPEMDGLEAIRAIREKEKRAGGHLPIIALTAHAMKGDREICLEAGADDYLTKPIHTPSLFAAIDRVRTHLTGVTQEAPPSIPPSEVMDHAAALDRVEGDRDLLEELARLFQEECPKLLDQIRGALDARESASLERFAHTLKGSSANLCARAVTQMAEKLEQQAHSGDLAGAQVQFKLLSVELDCLQSELDSFLRKVTR